MKVIAAMDSFKESLTALEACRAVKKGFESVDGFEVVCLPMADGGEGTVRSIVDASGGKIKYVTVTGPLGIPVESFYGITGDGKTAVIEMAAASGIGLIAKQKRNPLITTTKGTGELILAAASDGVEKIILGIGGSATNDAGAGMAQAIGVRLLDAEGKELEPGGGALDKLNSIDMSNVNPLIKSISFLVACDVDNPLTGPKGASAVFGPQKGATPEMVEQLDKNLSHFAKKVKQYLGKDIEHIPGAGSAGGLGAAGVAFLNAELKRGIEIVIETVDLESALKGVDLVITGEGQMDFQTAFGKTPMGVAVMAKKYNIPVIALAGGLKKGYEKVYDIGIDCAFSVTNGACTLEDAMHNGAINIEECSRNLARLIKKLK